MKCEYDARADVLLLKLRREKPDFGEQEGNVITHYSKSFKPVEIEILDASKTAVKVMRKILAAHKNGGSFAVNV